MAVQIAIEALAMLPYFLTTLILFGRRFNERVGALGAFMSPTFAAIALGPVSILVPVSSEVGIFARVLATIGQSVFLVFFFNFSGWALRTSLDSLSWCTVDSPPDIVGRQCEVQTRQSRACGTRQGTSGFQG